MRKAVTFLQSVARFRTNQTITENDVHEITGVRYNLIFEISIRRVNLDHS